MAENDKDWAMLPDDVLLHVFDLLRSIPDCLRSTAVCTSWSSAVQEMRRRRLPLLPDSPWLMVRETALQGGGIKYYRFSEHRFYTVPLPGFQPDCEYVLGCSFGWLIIAREELGDLYLLNPITGARIEDLPPTNAMSYAEALYGDEGELFRYRLEHTSWGSDSYTQHYFNVGFHKAVLSSNPSNGDYTIAVLNEEPALLTYARASDREWTTIFSDTPYDDIAFHGNKLYMITCGGVMQVLDLDEKNFCFDLLPSPARDAGRVFDYLTPCPATGDLFQVRMLLDSVPDTFAFSIYKIDDSKRKIQGEPEELLENLNFFVGRKNSICVPCSEFPELQPHCIHIYREGSILTCDWKEGSVEYVTIANDGEAQKFLPYIWIIPSLF